MARQQNSIRIQLPNEHDAIMQRALSAGASRMVLAQKAFLLEDAVRQVMVVDGKGSRQLGKERQIKQYKAVQESPFGGAYIYCISSVPDELKASMVGLSLFIRATQYASELGIGAPTWHNVYGGFVHDRLRDNERDSSITLLVLGNVPHDASNTKLEKLRDILTRYGSIPRIVITSSADPVSFMQETLKLPCHFGLYLGAKVERRY